MAFSGTDALYIRFQMPYFSTHRFGDLKYNIRFGYGLYTLLNQAHSLPDAGSYEGTCTLNSSHLGYNLDNLKLGSRVLFNLLTKNNYAICASKLQNNIAFHSVNLHLIKSVFIYLLPTM